jgi:hypothetical protein
MTKECASNKLTASSPFAVPLLLQVHQHLLLQLSITYHISNSKGALIANHRTADTRVSKQQEGYNNACCSKVQHP